MIKINLPCRAYIITGVFTGKNALSLSEIKSEGIITDYDEFNNYVSWTNLDGVQMPIVHISSVQFNPGK